MLRWFALLLLASVAITRAGIAQELPGDKTPRPRPVSKPHGSPPPRGKAPVSGSVYIGDRAPDFVLDGSNGRAMKLSGLRGEWIVLVFADRWRSVADLDAAERELRPLCARVVAVCHEKQQTLMTAVERDSISYLMLADATGEVSGVYGLFDWQTNRTEPGFFVLGRDGTVNIAVLGHLFPSDQLAYVAKLMMSEE